MIHLSRRHWAFVLLPGCSLLSLASVTDTLRLANEAIGTATYQCSFWSLDGKPVTTASGESLQVTGSLAALENRLGVTGAAAVAALCLVAETLPGGADHDAVQQLMRCVTRIDQRSGLLVALGTGAAWLAQAGALHGFRATLPALHAAALAAAHPDAIISGHWYEIDRNRLSCAGGSSGLDLSIQWLGQQHGEALVRQLLLHFGLERIRASTDRQLLPIAARIGHSTKLAEAVALMESNLAEPLSTEDIAGLVGVSRRQLERLFKQHLDTLPSRWYLEQRLSRARRLLQQTAQSILQIGLSCGFSSGAHFSNAYRQCFGHTPRDERSARAAAWRANTLQGPAALGTAIESNEDPT